MNVDSFITIFAFGPLDRNVRNVSNFYSFPENQTCFLIYISAPI